MEIRLSRYNLPFSDRPEPGVHYIPLDCQRDMRLGIYDAHVRAFYSVPKTNLFEVYDPLTGSTNIFDLDNEHYALPFVRNPVISLSYDDQQFLDELYFNSGIKAAARRSGRVRVTR